MSTKELTFLIKGGLEENLDQLTLLERELAVSTDTHKLFIGDSNGDPVPLTPDEAETAKKLSTPFTLSLNGDVTGSASIDGSQDKSIAVTLAESGVTVGTYDEVTVDEKGRVTAGTKNVYTANRALATDSEGKIASVAEVTLNELKALEGVSTSKTIQTQLDDLEGTFGDYVSIANLPEAVTEVELDQTTSGASLKVSVTDTETGAVDNSTIAFNIASDTTTGLMPKETFTQVGTLVTDVAALKGASTRYPVNLGVGNTSPTQQQLQSAYEQASGETGPAPDGATLVDLDNKIDYTWFANTDTWESRGNAAVSMATNDAPGIVLGSHPEDNDGKITVNHDGTMTLIGFGTKVDKTTTVAGKPLSSNVVLDPLIVKDGTDTIDTYNGSDAITIDLKPIIEAYLIEHATTIAEALATKMNLVTGAVANNVTIFGTGGAVVDSNIAMADVVLEGDILDGGSF